MQYDDLYRSLLLAASGAQKANSSNQQSLNKPDNTPPSSGRQMGRAENKPTPTINQTSGKQVCYDFQSKQGCNYGTSCKLDHVCIKRKCIGDHPQSELALDSRAEDSSTKLNGAGVNPNSQCEAECVQNVLI